MGQHLRLLALGLLGTTALAGPVAAGELEITCRCVIGGVSSATAD